MGSEENRTTARSLWRPLLRIYPLSLSSFVTYVGQYCIFKQEDCPTGFQEGYVFWDDEDNKNMNKKGGTLPDGVYDKDTLIYYCCRGDGDKLKPVLLPVISSFYLFTSRQSNSSESECQRVEGAVATEEYIRFDNEDSGNKDRWNGSYPYGAGINDHRIVYCYYESRLYLSRFFLKADLTAVYRCAFLKSCQNFSASKNHLKKWLNHTYYKAIILTCL